MSAHKLNHISCPEEKRPLTPYQGNILTLGLFYPAAVQKDLEVRENYIGYLCQEKSSNQY